jgi:hypothetical protein
VADPAQPGSAIRAAKRGGKHYRVAGRNLLAANSSRLQQPEVTNSGFGSGTYWFFYLFARITQEFFLSVN